MFTGIAVVAGVGTVVHGGALLRPVPAWIIPITGVLVAALVLHTGKRRRRGSARRVFLVVSAFSEKHWLAGFVQRLHGALDRSGIDLVLKVPDRDYDAAAQAHHMRRVLTARHDFVGGFVLAAEVHRMRRDLVEFCGESAVPVVFTDLEPFEGEDQYPENAAFVGYLSADIGALAGQWLASYLRPRGLRQPHVLIVASLEHQDRQTCCAEVLRHRVPDVDITINDGCAYRRSKAYDAVQSHIRLLDRRRGRLDAVFCTNDEMALGAVDALHAFASPITAATVVIGVDGIPEVRTMIDAGTSPLRATVVQDAHHLAENAVHVLERMHDRRHVVKRTVLRPEVYQAE
ncbi:sugar ABC transporter substrate-binding protein [Saccharothrix algeriensis]|uniref:Ribose transport system substrate-binding protein n=1 Tax=Saccharothrix algeriensis TaxID=173560 RepID=A0ABS2S1T1_9PSEU|nr:substrate-binding domain-containing protein [Saccharothrix algeriensis]MBM7809830.1 ribose transport system substrate-binding protein [Saccharothrix algeriensis]